MQLPLQFLANDIARVVVFGRSFPNTVSGVFSFLVDLRCHKQNKRGRGKKKRKKERREKRDREKGRGSVIHSCREIVNPQTLNILIGKTFFSTSNATYI